MSVCNYIWKEVDGHQINEEDCRKIIDLSHEIINILKENFPTREPTIDIDISKKTLEKTPCE